MQVRSSQNSSIWQHTSWERDPFMKRFHCFWVSSSQAAKSSLSVTDWSTFKADGVLADVLATCAPKQQCLSVNETTAKLLKPPSIHEGCCVLHLAQQ